MFIVPEEFKPLLSQLQAQFTRAATARRMLWLMFAAVLVSSNRTISNLLRLLSLIQAVNPSTYHRVVSHRSWNTNYLAKALIGFLLERYIPTGKIRLCGDETVDGHRGKNVYAKARHRDAVRSTHSHTVFRYGHKWIVLAILVEFPACSRPFALPVLVALYRDQATNAKEGRRHKTPAQLMCGLLCQLMRWFPKRNWQFTEMAAMERMSLRDSLIAIASGCAWSVDSSLMPIFMPKHRFVKQGLMGDHARRDVPWPSPQPSLHVVKPKL